MQIVKHYCHDTALRQSFNRAMEESTFRTECTMADNPGLIFFYVSQFMQECVYHDEALNAWVIAEAEDGELLIHTVFAPADVSLDAVIAAFGSGVTFRDPGLLPYRDRGLCLPGIP